MSHRDTYPAGVPCWVETLQPDPAVARAFYAAVLGWEYEGDDDYAVARVDGDDVAGIVPLPPGLSPAWVTQVRVADLDHSFRHAITLGARPLTEPLDVPPAGRLAAVTDPTGATICLWEAGVREGAMRVNEPGAWAMSALSTPDPEAAIRFYGALFGWQAEAWGPVTLLRLPGYVGGEPAQPVPRDVVAVLMPGEQPSWSVDFWVDDADAAVASATARGAQVVVPLHDRPPGFRSAVLADPAGAMFGVSRPPQA